MCGKKSKIAWQLLAVLLVWSGFSFSAFSQAESSPASSFLEAAAQIVQKHPDSKPQLLQMASALQTISDNSQAKIKELQTIIEQQAIKLQDSAKTITNLEQSQKDYESSVLTERLHLKSDISAAKTSEVVGWSVAGAAVVFGIVEAVLRELKK